LQNIDLQNKDCLERLAELEDGSVDLIVTDPPYGISYTNNRRKVKGKIKTEDGILNDTDNNDFLEKVINECFRVLKDGRHFYWFGRFDALPEQIINIKEAGFKLKNQLIWLKNNHGTGDLFYSYGSKHEVIIYGIKRTSQKIKPLLLQELNGTKRHTDILEFGKVSKKDMIHDHQKPVELIEFLIQKSSLEGDVVLDPFAGSASTAIACKNLNRNFIGTELDTEIFKDAIKRIEDK
jgi:DNA modification methylase